jgi:hypothetical protein
MASKVAERELDDASLRRPASEQYPQVVSDEPPAMTILLISSIASKVTEWQTIDDRRSDDDGTTNVIEKNERPFFDQSSM